MKRKYVFLQKLYLECIMKRKDVFFSTKTGSGKSICYQSGPFMLQSSDDSHRHMITLTRHSGVSGSTMNQ